MNKNRTFGSYKIEVENNHATISRVDNKDPEPNFYELQYMKDLAFGGDSRAIEVFPIQNEIIDGQPYRHLWKINEDILPSLFTGKNE